MQASIAETTHSRYKTCLQVYMAFCKRLDLQAFPVHQQNVILFVSNLADTSTSYGSIKAHIAAIKFFAETQGFNEKQQTINAFQKLYRLIRGIKKTQGKRFRKAPREPITPNVLKAIHFNMANSSRPYEDKIMLWAAMLTAFFGFLRVSEYTSEWVKTFDPASTLCCQDLTFVEQSVQINIKASKTDPFRLGVSIRLATNNSYLCPVGALKNYWRIHPSRKGPLFVFLDGKYLTRKGLAAVLKDVLPETCKNISTHSFRIGAATTAAANGHPRWLIQSLGRWTSDCYRQYLRIPLATIQEVSQSMTQLVSTGSTYDPDNF